MNAIRHIVLQPCFYNALLSGLLAASVCFFATWHAGHEIWGYDLTRSLPDRGVYGNVVSLVFFSLVFRTGFAVNRYHQAAGFLVSITGSWFCVASSLVAFTKSSEPNARPSDFQHLAIRLLSMINALGFEQLSHEPQTCKSGFFAYDVINAHGIDGNTLDTIEQSPRKVETAYQMLQVLVSESQKKQIISAPPPIASRVFQEMSSGLLRFHEATRLSRTALPLHYKLIARVLLAIYTVYTPLEYASWSNDPFVGTSFTLVMTFAVWFMHGVSCLLEHPFTFGAGVLDLQDVHETLNAQLLTLLEETGEPVAFLGDQAILDVKRLRRSRASVQVSHTSKTLKKAQCEQTSSQILPEQGRQSTPHVIDLQKKARKDSLQTPEVAECERIDNQITLQKSSTDEAVQDNTRNTVIRPSSSTDIEEFMCNYDSKNKNIDGLPAVHPRFPIPPVQRQVTCIAETGDWTSRRVTYMQRNQQTDEQNELPQPQVLPTDIVGKHSIESGSQRTTDPKNFHEP